MHGAGHPLHVLQVSRPRKRMCKIVGRMCAARPCPRPPSRSASAPSPRRACASLSAMLPFTTTNGSRRMQQSAVAQKTHVLPGRLCLDVAKSEKPYPSVARRATHDRTRFLAGELTRLCATKPQTTVASLSPSPNKTVGQNTIPL